jgi:hypothetical protein
MALGDGRYLRGTLLVPETIAISRSGEAARFEGFLFTVQMQKGVRLKVQETQLVQSFKIVFNSLYLIFIFKLLADD